MAIYKPQDIGIKAPLGGFKEGGWYSGRQYVGGTLSEPGVIHPSSTQQGAGQAVSPEVLAASARQQGKTPEQITSYLAAQRQVQPVQPAPQPAIPTPVPSIPTTGVTGAQTTPTAGLVQPEQINLPKLYENLYESSGVSKLQQDLSERERKYNTAVAKINDNPYLSEATREGRLATLNKIYNADTANLRNDIAVKRADVETRLNLQTKQYDINSQAAKDALTRFNSLLSIGALDNASGEDIANLVRATGIESSLIQSAIKTRTDKKKEVNSQLITSTADNGVVTATLINKDTGEVISQKSLGAIGNVQQGPKATEAEKRDYYFNAVKTLAGPQGGATLDDVMRTFSGKLSFDDILTAYNSSSIYGPAEEDINKLRQKYAPGEYKAPTAEEKYYESIIKSK